MPKAEALVDTAKEMAAADATPDLGNRLRQLQLMWKEEVGALPQKRGKELWDVFKAACDQVYEKVKGVRAEEDVKFAAVTGALLGWPVGLFALMLGFAFGAGLAVVLLLLRVRSLKDSVPLTPFLAVAAIATGLTAGFVL